MDIFSQLQTAELAFGDFLLPWGMVIGALGFLVAWAAVFLIERRGWTQRIWNLPLFFVALAVFFGCAIGLLFAP
jgi:hypothetical protein